ncbi:putative imidazolonepropionase [Arapaima gigas]
MTLQTPEPVTELSPPPVETFARGKVGLDSGTQERGTVLCFTMAETFRLFVKNAQQLVAVCSGGERFLAGDRMQRLAVIDNGAVVVGRDGLVRAVGSTDVLEKQFRQASFDKVIDASGMVVVPGLIDSHTHPVWAGDRVHEFAMKLAGATYMEVHQAGGGIHFTVEHTRRATPEQLFSSLTERLTRMLRAGTTLVECKSGYGLDLDTELKMLTVVEKARTALPMGISSTYCGAHAVPKGRTEAEAVQDIVQVQLPRLQEKMALGELRVNNIDVFCEKGVFDLDSTRTILQAGKALGLQINFHGDELHPMNSAEVGDPQRGIGAMCHSPASSIHSLALWLVALVLAMSAFPLVLFHINC